MSHNITCSTKIFTLVIAHFFWFYLVSSANLLWCQRCCLLSDRTVTHIGQYIPQRDLNLTVYSCHVTYAFQSESTLCSCLNVKELLALRNTYVTWQGHTVKCTVQISSQNAAQSFGQFGQMVECSFKN